jgi:hypothetical protein
LHLSRARAIICYARRNSRPAGDDSHHTGHISNAAGTNLYNVRTRFYPGKMKIHHAQVHLAVGNLNLRKGMLNPRAGKDDFDRGKLNPRHRTPGCDVGNAPPHHAGGLLHDGKAHLPDGI